MNPYIQYMYSYPHKTAYGPLMGISLADYAHALQGPGHGLYLHIPFCETKCGYCNLFSVTGQDSGAVDQYLDAVDRQLAQYGEILDSCKTEFSDFTIGGGTPLFLNRRQLERVFASVDKRLRLSEKLETAVETAPNQTTPEKLNLLKQAGATRISMGIQSFSQAELQTLWRRHSPQKAKEALWLLKSFDFPCINLDFIYGIPGQTVDSLLSSLREALTFEPDELFLYPLYIKHGAGLQKCREGAVLDPDQAFRQYQEASGFLRSQGFYQISMRRFTRAYPHPAPDCGFSTSLALGCGGRSYLGRLHFCSPYATDQATCLRQIHAFQSVRDFTDIEYGILLSEDEEKRRYVIRHLFIYPGLDAKKYRRRFGSSPTEDFPLLEKWTREGFLKEGPLLSATEKGLGLADCLGPQLISPDIRSRMEKWEALYG